MSNADSKNSSINSFNSYFFTENSIDSDLLSTINSFNKPMEYKKKILFLCFYDLNSGDTVVLISNSIELDTYNKKYSELFEKNRKNINRIWADINIYMPLYGQLPLKDYKFILYKKLGIIKKKFNYLTEEQLTDSNTNDSNQFENEDSLIYCKPKNENLKKLDLSLKLNKQFSAVNCDSIKSLSSFQHKITGNNKKIKTLKIVEKSKQSNCNNKKNKQKSKMKKKKGNKIKNLRNANINMENTNENFSYHKIEEINTSSDNLKISEVILPIFEHKVKNKTQFISKKEIMDYNEKNKKFDFFISNKNNMSYKKVAKAIALISKNNLEKALKYLNKIISYNSSNDHHILNRCYCYLRMCNNDLALYDATCILQTSTNNKHLFLANLRAGQALFATQKFFKAEIHFKNANYINPKNYPAQRELIRTQIAILVNKGFKEKDAILKLKLYSSLMDIKNFNEDIINLNKSKFGDVTFFKENYDDILYSSEEDEEPNSVEILNNILNYKHKEKKLHHIISNVSNSYSSISTMYDKLLKRTMDDKVQVNNKSLNNKFKRNTIWVGGLTNSITESTLKLKFKKFGNVLSVYRPNKKSYAFVNFEQKEDVINILKKPYSYKIGTVKLDIQHVIQQIIS